MSARRSLWTMFALSLGCSAPTAPHAPAEEAARAEATPPGTAPEVFEAVSEALAPSREADLPDAREVTFTSADGITLHGTLQAGQHPATPMVVLVHQHGGSRADWTPLVERLRRGRRIGYLAIDLRGHGQSVEDARDRPLSFRDFDRAAWERTALDVRAALNFLRSDESELTPSRVGAVGASMGATATLLAAAAEPALSPLVLLSPGRAYHGVDGITPAVGLTGRRLFTVAATSESDVAETARTLSRIGATTPIEVAGEAHGAALLSEATTLEEVASLVERALYE